MRILALDLSKRSTGWACASVTDAKPSYGHWVLGSEYTCSGKVFVNLHVEMSKIHSLGRIDAVFYEDAINILPGARNTSVHAIKLASGLIAHAESWAEAMECRVVSAVNMATWRRSFFGNIGRKHGRSDLKDYAMERARQLGFKPRNDDQADAIGILDYAIESLGHVPVWRANEVLRPPLVRAGR